MKDPVPFLTFQGKGKLALDFYASIFANFKIQHIQFHEGDEMKDKIFLATFSIGNQQILISDSLPVHDWDFSPAISFYIECASSDEIKDISSSLGENGKYHMPLDNYGFSTLFCWVQDQFGINWQLSLPD